MPKVLRIAKGRKVEDVDHVGDQLWDLGGLDVTVALIQALVPLGFHRPLRKRCCGKWICPAGGGGGRLRP